jgi:hypothetical protein
MIINEENTKPHEPSLIEDIAPPHTQHFTDVEREEVRRRSVGSLYKQYSQNSKAKINALRKQRALENQKKDGAAQGAGNRTCQASRKNPIFLCAADANFAVI